MKTPNTANQLFKELPVKVHRTIEKETVGSTAIAYIKSLVVVHTVATSNAAHGLSVIADHRGVRVQAHVDGGHIDLDLDTAVWPGNAVVRELTKRYNAELAAAHALNLEYAAVASFIVSGSTGGASLPEYRKRAVQSLAESGFTAFFEGVAPLPI